MANEPKNGPDGYIIMDKLQIGLQIGQIEYPPPPKKPPLKLKSQFPLTNRINSIGLSIMISLQIGQIQT